jgi:DNA polymerase-3 subunit delta'
MLAMYERIAPEQHDSLDEIPEPSETVQVFGHDAAAAQLAAAHRASKLPHALIFAGPRGIGKASLAFQLAHYLLAHPSEGGAPEMFVPRDPGSSLYRQVASGAHPSVLHLTRPFNDKTKTFKTALTVDEVRRVGRFLSLTAHDGGYRVVIVDPADDMNTNAANALLKNLEEPPARTIFILIAHSLGRLLPTIRSRCQILRMQPLGDEDLISALAAIGKDPGSGEREQLLARAGGSVRSAVMLTEYGGVEIAEALDKLVNASNPPATETHRLAEAVAGRDRAIQFGIFNDHALDILAREASAAAERGDSERANRISEAWQNSRIAILDTDTYNLDRKQHVLSMIARLNDTFRM